MKKLLLLLSLCLGITVCSNAQNAKSVLDKTAANFTQKGIVKAEIELETNPVQLASENTPSNFFISLVKIPILR